jgi:hypothetical protein
MPNSEEGKEREGKKADASQRKKPHPPNRRREKIITTSHSLFFWETNMIEISYKNNKRVSDFFFGENIV